MPYTVKENGTDFEVVNTDSGEVKAKHATKEAAERQVKLLHQIEKEWGE